jgi:hypothetical protein
MDTNTYLADTLARHHIEDLVADADASRRAKQARRARAVAAKAKRRRG